MQPDQPRQAILATADRQRPQIRMRRDRRRFHDEGQGITADELQHHRPRPSGTDAAEHGTEPVREVVGVIGEVRWGLAGHQPHLYPVGVAGSGDLAEYRQQDPALVDAGEPADGHHRAPAAAVEPGPPLTPGGGGDPAGERDRPRPPPHTQDRSDGQDQVGEAGTASVQPDQDQHSQHRSNDRVPDDEPGQPPQQAAELHHRDDPARRPVHRRPHDRDRERVRVGELR
jgi:hypothetical protein